MEVLSEEKLDSEFRQILFLIKPHIVHINNPYHIEQYKVWLERLNNSKTEEKFERNMYVVELANQIHDGVLKPPFIAKPPAILPRIQRFDRGEVLEHDEWPYAYEYKKSPEQYCAQNTVSSPRHQERLLPKKKINKLKVVRPFQYLGKSISVMTNAKSSDGSWYDLSEASLSTASTLNNNNACGDTDLEDLTEEDENANTLSMKQHRETALQLKEKYEKKCKGKYCTSKISRVPSFDLKKFYAMENTEKKTKNADVKESFVSPTSPPDKEVEALRMRMKDLLEVKKALKDTRCLTEDRKRAIQNLNSKLGLTEKRNGEYRRIINLQKKKITELETQKSRDLKEFKETFTNLHSTEIDFLKQRHAKEMQNLEKNFQTKIEEIERKYQGEVEKVKKSYEDKINAIKSSHTNIVKEKDVQISQLKSEAQARSDDMVSIDQTLEINHLKKCISKLDKLLNKNEKDYVRKIEKLKQELDMKEMVSQVQLHTQKADLMVRHSATRQEELKSSLNDLETKYRRMMGDLQQHAQDAKKRDKEIIEELRQHLEKNKIAYCNTEGN